MGFWSKGGIGPGKGFSSNVLHVVLKVRSMGPVRGCARFALGIDLKSIQGKSERGTCVKDSSSVIQSLVDLWICQLIILVR